MYYEVATEYGAFSVVYDEVFDSLTDAKAFVLALWRGLDDCEREELFFGKSDFAVIIGRENGVEDVVDFIEMGATACVFMEMTSQMGH